MCFATADCCMTCPGILTESTIPESVRTRSDVRMTSTSAGRRPLMVRAFSDAVPATRKCRVRRARLKCPLLVRIAEVEEMVGIVGITTCARPR